MIEPTVYIIDDDPSVRKGLTRLLEAAGMLTESFASAKDFLGIASIDKPGCIVLDVQMPEMTGPELQEELGKMEFSIPIIFLSAHGDVPITAKAMKKGAVDFLTKPVDGNDLIAAIHISLENDRANRHRKAESDVIHENINALTPREHEVMTYVISGMLNKQIAGALNISQETVKIHRGRVMQKLGIASVAELVRLCETVGIAPNNNIS
jgi:RNA polymerase sigma factor (sigma-70 family)